MQGLKSELENWHIESVYWLSIPEIQMKRTVTMGPNPGIFYIKTCEWLMILDLLFDCILVFPHSDAAHLDFLL